MTAPSTDLRAERRRTLVEATVPLQLLAAVPAALALALPLVRYHPYDGEQHELGLLTGMAEVHGWTDGPAVAVLVLLAAELALLAGLAAAALTVVPDPDRARQWRRRRALAPWVTCAATLLTLLAVVPVLGAVGDRSPGETALFAVHGTGLWTAVVAVGVTALVQVRVDRLDAA